MARSKHIFKKNVENETNAITSKPIVITSINIFYSFKGLKCNKARGVDGLASEHYIFAHDNMIALYKFCSQIYMLFSFSLIFLP